MADLRRLLSPLLLLTPGLALGQLSPPTICGTRPIGAAPGERLTLELRGSDLDGASALAFEDARIHAEVTAKADRLSARVTLPKDVPPGPLRFRVVTPKGVSKLGTLYVGRPLATITEAEPNDGFR